MAEKSPADQVKEAVWKYTAQGLTLAIVFGGGLFLGSQLWGPGAGDMGQPALAKRVEELDLEVNRVKNEREDCKKVMEVTQSRYSDAQKKTKEQKKELKALKKELDALKADAS